MKFPAECQHLEMNFPEAETFLLTGSPSRKLSFSALKFWIQGFTQTISLTWENITGKPATFPPSSHPHEWTDITNPPALGAALPVGSIVLWLAETIPAGWYKLDGSPSPACLQAIFGATLPNMIFRIPLGAGGVYGLKSTGGADQKTLSISEIPPHGGHVNSDRVMIQQGGTGIWGGYAYSGGGQAFSLLNPYLAVYYIAYGGT